MDVIDVIYIIILLSLGYFTFFHLILWFEAKGKLKRPLPKDSQLPKVSILVPAYNEEKIIEKTLEKLLSINYPQDKLEVIVIDDGSKDDTFKIAKKFESRNVRVLKKRNSGKATSLNFGIKHAKNEFIATMDADSFLGENALRQCMSYFDESSVAAVTSHILVKRRKTLWEKLQHTEHMIVSLMRKAQEQVNVINATPGPLSVYRKGVLVKVGGFDEKNLVEDVEIAWRLLRNGYKIKMAFDAMVHSMYPDTFNLWWKQRRRWNIGGIQTFFKYRMSLFDRKSHGVGNFLMPTWLIGYTFSLVGIGLFAYLVIIRAFNYVLYLIAAFSAGTNPFSRFEFGYTFDLLFIYGFISFIVSLFVIKLGIQTHKEKTNLWLLALFITIYPTLLTVNVLISLYKFARMERGWLTK